MTRYSEEYGPNVTQILVQATRVIRGRVPRSVRNELMDAVKAGVLGRLKKDGLKPEIFFHPDHKHGAIERQRTEALYAVQCISKVVVPASDLTPGDLTVMSAAQPHDPLARQMPDEPRFVLLARDPTAPDLVRLWLAIRKRDGHLIDQIVKRLKEQMVKLPYQPNKTPQHILSAQAVANKMNLWLTDQQAPGRAE